MPWADLEAVLEAELGAPSMRSSPASTVHLSPPPRSDRYTSHDAIRLRRGRQVQRPGIRPAVERDLDIAQRIARRLEEGTAWGRSIGVRTLADGLAAPIREELDYRIEADNLRTVAAGDGHASAIHVPAIHPDLCTERVLVMERLHGTPVNAAQVRLVDRGLDRPALARRLLGYLLRQMLLDGVFHADPHAGNVFVLDDGRIGLLDFGSVGRVDAGIGALVAASPVALTVLTMIGGVYLMWLGGKALAHPATHSAGPAASTHGSWRTLAQGVAVSGLNPKGLLIFVAMLPHFTDPHADWPVAGQIGVLGLVCMLSCAVVYLLVGSPASAVLNARPAAARAVSLVSSVAMIIIGAVLLVEHLAAQRRSTGQWRRPAG